MFQSVEASIAQHLREVYASFVGAGALAFGNTYAIRNAYLAPPRGPMTLAQLRGDATAPPRWLLEARSMLHVSVGEDHD